MISSFTTTTSTTAAAASTATKSTTTTTLLLQQLYRPKQGTLIENVTHSYENIKNVQEHKARNRQNRRNAQIALQKRVHTSDNAIRQG